MVTAEKKFYEENFIGGENWDETEMTSEWYIKKNETLSNRFLPLKGSRQSRSIKNS